MQTMTKAERKKYRALEKVKNRVVFDEIIQRREKKEEVISRLVPVDAMRLLTLWSSSKITPNMSR